MREWILLQRGYFDLMEQDYKLRWELARWQTYILALPNAKKGALSKPEDLVKFPWDLPPEKPAMEDDELREFMSKMGTKIENGKFVN